MEKKIGKRTPSEKVVKEEKKVFLTEEERQALEILQKKQQLLAQQKDYLAELNVAIYESKEKALSVTKEIPNLKKDIELTESNLVNQLTAKYGKFQLSENGEVIKVG